MKQKHIFLFTITHYGNDNSIICNNIQGQITKETNSSFFVKTTDGNKICPKHLFTNFEVFKDEFISDCFNNPTITTYRMGFIWEDGDDEHLIHYKASECQRRCKIPVIDYLNEICNEISKSIDKLIKTQFGIKI